MSIANVEQDRIGAGASRQGCIKLGLVHVGAGLREVFHCFLLTLKVEPMVAHRRYPELYLASRFGFGNMDMAM